MAAFRAQLQKARNIIVMTGAGVSAESGVPTFRGAGGYWRRYQSQVNAVSHESTCMTASQNRNLLQMCFRI